MAQRNPMNQRYAGDGPGGQTRKSAARMKPATQAASSVRIKKKPQTDAEKRAARKAREAEEKRKADEKSRRQAEKAKADGQEIEQPKKQGFFGSLKSSAQRNVPTSEEYKKWKKVYWALLVAGIVCVMGSFLTQTTLLTSNQTAWMFVLGGAYACIIAAFIVDFKKVRPLMKKHQQYQQGGAENKTPKQLKHEQEAKERAEAIEAARKAAKAAKRNRRKRSDTIVPGEEQ